MALVVSFVQQLGDENESLICAACCDMALTLASYAFRDITFYFDFLIFGLGCFFQHFGFGAIWY